MGQEVLAPAMAERARDTSHHWKPGQSGNPTGYSGLYGEVRRMCRNFTPEGVLILQAIARDASADDRARIVAVQTILDRGWGKVKEQPEEQRERPPIDMGALSDSELELMEKLFTKALGEDAVLHDDPEEDVVAEPEPSAGLGEPPKEPDSSD